MKWQILDTGRNRADENMRIDQALLDDLDPQGPPLLHLYDWEGDCATYGYFLDPLKYLNAEGVKKRGLHLAKRPTGGGIILHVCDLAFSALVPAGHPQFSINTLDNYAFINRLVIKALNQFTGNPKLLSLELLQDDPRPLDASSKHFCMAKPTKYDVMHQGLKIGGAAQRRVRQGLLHQGTISLGMLDESYLYDILRSDTCVMQAMKANSFSFLGSSWSEKELQTARDDLKNALICSVQTNECL